MLQKVTRLDSVPTAEETVLTMEMPTKGSRLYTLLYNQVPHLTQGTVWESDNLTRKHHTQESQAIQVTTMLQETDITEGKDKQK